MFERECVPAHASGGGAERERERERERIPSRLYAISVPDMGFELLNREIMT